MSTTDAEAFAGDTTMQNLADALSTGLLAPPVATAPEPEPVAAAKTYRVTGPHIVLGTPSGETFTTVLDPGQEAFLIEVGHIAVVDLDDQAEGV
jgi:hypothetical protein